jgi:hypothetical protein
MQDHLIAAVHTFCELFLLLETSPSHSTLLAGVDAKTGYVFCSECNDFIYHHQLEEIQLHATVSAEESMTRFQGTK